VRGRRSGRDQETSIPRNCRDRREATHGGIRMDARPAVASLTRAAAVRALKRLAQRHATDSQSYQNDQRAGCDRWQAHNAHRSIVKIGLQTLWRRR